MTSFKEGGGAIKRACPCAVDLSYNSSPEMLSSKKMEWKALEGMQRKRDVTVCVMYTI